MSGAVVVDRRGGVVTVTINRPQRYNALSRSGLEELADTLETLGADPENRCLVLTGAGAAFCSGADLSVDPAASGDEESRRVMDAANRTVSLLTSVPFPVIAAVNGPAVGVGASLVFAADLAVVARSAYFLLPFTGIGLLPDGGATSTVAASVGRARALRLALRHERLPADEAYAVGLVAEVCELDELMALVDEWADELAAGPRQALADTKTAVNAATLGTLPAVLDLEAELQIGLLAGADFAEGVAAFGERRPPVFSR